MSTPSSVRRQAPWLFLFACAAPLCAQGKALFENVAEGYRLFVSKAIKAVPTEPNERQTLAKWGATLEFRDKLYRGKRDCAVMLVRIRKAKGPETGGAAPKEDDTKDDSPTIRAQSIESLNAGVTVEEFL